MQAVAHMEKIKAHFALGYRQLVAEAGLSYASFMRWRQRIGAGKMPLLRPGPKKIAPLNLTELTRRISSLDHGQKRSRATGGLHASYKGAVSRRELNAMIASVRREETRSRTAQRCRVIWRRANLVWAIDGCEYVVSPEAATLHVANLQDLCAHYKFPPLATGAPACGEEVAGHLDRHFARYAPPLFVKRDNGGNLNHVAVNQLLEDAMVIPINSPVKKPPYNGAIEHSQGEIKGYLKKWRHKAATPEEMFLLVETAANNLNHRPRRSLGGRTACRCYFGNNRIRYSKRKRQAVYCWIRDLAMDLSQATGTDVVSPTAWRVAAKQWLVKNRMITIVRAGKVLPHFLPILSHN